MAFTLERVNENMQKLGSIRIPEAAGPNTAADDSLWTSLEWDTDQAPGAAAGIAIVGVAFTVGVLVGTLLT